MKISKRKSVTIATVVILVLVGVIILLYFRGNVSVGYYDKVQAGIDDGFSISIGPCEANKLSDRSDITFVFTNPFTSLDNFENAKTIKKVKLNQGTGKISMIPGKYGLYLEYEDSTKRLYNDLSLENPRNDVPRNEQGPWYVIVNPFNNSFDFKESSPC